MTPNKEPNPETDFEAYIKAVLREEMTNTLSVLDQFLNEH